MSTVQAIRTVLFYLLLSASAFVWGTLSFFIAPILPFRARYRFVVQNWCRFAIWL
ncbi:1-acyl-sn-glycerol-3-phosphate acyltransferase, partial [Pseudomonas aeruginosa]